MAAASDREGQRLVSTQTVQHDYLTLNGKVARETITTDGTVTAILDFVYDESGRPFALNYSTNGGRSFDTYYYVLNLQGDVVKLVWYIPGFEYEAVATYTYDAWGNILTATGDMAEINPLRYRGYYYDTETGFYYLQSRYYDPVNRRFINADVFTSTGQGILGTNMFAYCLNNPVSLSDPSGMAGGGTTATKMKSGLASATASLYGAALIFFFLSTTVDNDSDVLPLEVLLERQGKTQLLPQSTEDELSEIAGKYELLECYQAAMAKATNYRGHIVRLEFKASRHGFVACDKFPSTAISVNGNHYGYLYESVVYCNVYPEGLPLDVWLRSFYTYDDPYYYTDGVCLGQLYP